MDYLFELLKIIIPAGLVIYGMFIITVSFLKKEKEMKWLDIKSKNSEQIIPLRIQAGERLCLLLERILQMIRGRLCVLLWSKPFHLSTKLTSK